jgi:hypothetical protein
MVCRASRHLLEMQSRRSELGPNFQSRKQAWRFNRSRPQRWLPNVDTSVNFALSVTWRAARRRASSADQVGVGDLALGSLQVRKDSILRNVPFLLEDSTSEGYGLVYTLIVGGNVTDDEQGLQIFS